MCGYLSNNQDALALNLPNGVRTEARVAWTVFSMIKVAVVAPWPPTLALHQAPVMGRLPVTDRWRVHQTASRGCSRVPTSKHGNGYLTGI